MVESIVVVLILFIINYVPVAESYSPEFLNKIPPVDYSLANAARSDIIYHLFTVDDGDAATSSSTHGLILTHANITDDAVVNRHLPTKVFFHGFTTDHTSPWFTPLKNAYLKKGPHNIIYVNWSKAGNLTYDVSAANVKPVGEFVADFLIEAQIPHHNVHLIGHSLGSHLSGFVGKYIFNKTAKKVHRITALDPAGPSFERAEIDGNLRLSDADATLVDVIHTDVGHYGFNGSIGHVDFYPNGGTNQPGCVPVEDDNCNHARSTHYFIESIRNGNKWKAKKVVKNEEDVKDEDKTVFGDGVPLTARGLYHVDINSD